MMSVQEQGERPRKKRRFFVDNSPSPEPAPADATELDLNSVNPQPPAVQSNGTPASGSAKLDYEQFVAIVGERPDSEDMRLLDTVSGGDLNRAINMFFDGSYKAAKPPALSRTPTPRSSAVVTPQQIKPSSPEMPHKRYVGALGVAGWATKSGSLLKAGETVRIERSAPRVVAKARAALKRQDVIVRFTNVKGEEIGRLEQDTAAWISTLLDQKVCVFEGSCIFAPERLRTNDTVFLQLKAFMTRQTFEAGNFVKPTENNRQTGIFEAKESEDERKLRLRQVALVKLFSEINLQPARVNEMTEKHKKEGILQAAEMAERFDADKNKDTTQSSANGGSSPPSEDNEEGQELEQDQLDSLYKKAQSFDFDTPELQPAETFAMDLRKYQKQALHWMVGKEKDQKSDHKEASMHPLWEEYHWPKKDVEEKDLPVVDGQESFYVNPYSGELSLDFPVQEQNCLGGILADEMGLGKTIEMLSLVHTHTSEYGLKGNAKTGSTVLDLPRLPKSSTGVERAPCTTLVIAPMSLLAQWASEAEKASRPGTLKVLMYYGTEKSANLRNLCCEANAANAPNLIVTSYGTVLSEFNQVASAGGNRGASGGLFSLDYFRIILDEAHMIKNRQSKTAKACYELSATHRWTLTGTPIVNRLEDLFSLVRFLRVEPWSNFSFWKTFITVPFESKDFIRALDVVQTVLEPLVLRRTKDMKTPSGEPLVPLPPKTIDIEKVELSKVERELYDHIFARAKRTFSANVEAGTVMKSYTTIFAQILRLRQSCDHPSLTRNKNIVADEEEAEAAADIANGLADDMDLQSLIQRFEAEAADGEQDASRFGAHVLKQIQDDEGMECPICSEEPMEDHAVTGCWHSACKKCLMDYIEHQTNKNEIPRCFNCREPINARDVFEVIRHDRDEDEDEAMYRLTQPEQASTPRITLRRVNQLSSAKVASLLTHLKRIKKASPQLKSVVFSQFTSFLDILEPQLKGAGIPYLRFDGTVSQKQRAAILADFANRPKGCVLLLSLRAGGVGLNLVCAKRVFMMDPWWSWAVEAQAIDRIHRMGQTDEVKVVRFVVEASIEEKMLRIQDRKKFIAGSLGMMSEEERRVQKLEDIKELLS
ncbi:putative DNA repair protein rad-5 [Myriangium duriaei CBS 260.36]|uniref:DNA repair protein rad-5 n=1 Tax=Myriangium duriaei CBS 260.36 TaxID=1168546 RepID=A0A9P4J7R8_9PEZI|nr:putative DNA repair protein rad-5 [Myriangium duriaei CBS 260.36]